MSLVILTYSYHKAILKVLFTVKSLTACTDKLIPISKKKILEYLHDTES